MMETNTASSAYPTVMTNSAIHLYHAWFNTNVNKTCLVLENQTRGGWLLSKEHHILYGSLQVLMMQVILVNSICLSVYYVLKPLKQTKFVCNILAGIILRSITRHITDYKSQCTRNCPHNDTVQTLFPVEGEILMKTLGCFGVTLFIFLTAVKMDITMMWRTVKKTKSIGILSLCIPFLCVLCLVSGSDLATSPRKQLVTGAKFKRKNMFPILYAAGLSVTRFTNLAYAFYEMDLLTSKLGRLAMSATMIDELFTWCSVILGTTFGRSVVKRSLTNGLREGLLTAFIIVLMVLFTVLVIRPILVLIVKKTPHGKPVKRIFVVGILLMVMAMTCITDMLGTTHIGALVLGLAVPSGPPLGSDLVHMAELFVMDYLMPLFYITIGYNVKMSTLADFSELRNKLKIFITSVLVSSVTKFIGGFIGALASKLSGKHAVIIGLMMNIKGPMDLFLVYRWSNRKEFNDGSYTVLIFSYTILTAIVTALIDILYKEKMSAHVTSKPLRQLQTNPSIGEMRIMCCIHDDQDIPIFLSFLKASNPTINSPTTAYVAHLNSLEGRAVSLISHDDRQIRRVHSNRTDQIAFEFEKYAADSNGLVTTDMYTMIAPYKSMHQDIVALAQDENIALIVTPFHNNYAALEVNEAGGVNIFTKKLLKFSPCTVGILIDKGMSQLTAPDENLFCNIGVLFIGGADDREAATFATRMLGNPSVKMTMVRLVVTNYYNNNNNQNDVEEEKFQLKLDQGVINEFRIKSEKKHNVVYREIKVETIDEALDGIRTLGSAQNLILVGRQRHAANSIFDEALLEWSQHPELGSVGDFVVSSDFQDGKTSILVMQRYNGNEGGSHHSIHISESNASP